MKAVILAGGLGTRLSEETDMKPKPMVEIGGMPILWHIMKIFSSYDVNEFIICCGYKGYMIKEYFYNYQLHLSDITIDNIKHEVHIHQKNAEPWKITLVDTGETTMTGGRLKRVANYIGSDNFLFTYGDGVGNVDITSLVRFHNQQNTLATLTAVSPPGRFGVLTIDNELVTDFDEKPHDTGSYINGGFFVLSPQVIDLIDDDATIWECEPLSELSAQKQLSAYRHNGFWQPMDTLRDKIYLNQLWSTGEAPWKLW